MTRPAHLGGNRPATPSGAVSIVEAVMMRADLDPQSGQWLLTVKIEGGRVLSGVKPTHQGGGGRSGSYAPLPARGEAGLVAFPSSRRNAQRPYWLASAGAYFGGAHREEAGEHLSLDASGRGEHVSASGARTRRVRGGDTLFEGPVDADPKPFTVRPRDYGDTGEIAALADEEDAPEWKSDLDGTRRLRLWRMRTTSGELVVDDRPDSGEASLRTLIIRDDVPMRARFQGLPGESLSVLVSRDEPGRERRAELSADLSGGTARLELEREGKRVALQFTADGEVVRADAEEILLGREDDQLESVATAPPVDANLEMLADRLSAAEAKIMRLEAVLTTYPKTAPIMAGLQALTQVKIPFLLRRTASRNTKARGDL